MDADFSSQRIKMVDGQLRTTDVTNAAILDAMGAIPRERFVGEGWRALAYIDEDVRVAPARGGAGPRYLMEPSPLAKLLQLAEIQTTDRVLDVGCATGDSAAVLSKLAASVVALESDPDLASAAAPKTPDERKLIGKNQHAERNHPEAEYRKKAKAAKKDEGHADRHPLAAGVRHVEIAPQNLDLAALRGVAMDGWIRHCGKPSVLIRSRRIPASGVRR